MHTVGRVSMACPAGGFLCWNQKAARVLMRAAARLKTYLPNRYFNLAPYMRGSPSTAYSDPEDASPGTKV
jgi:hypothetical protein